MYARVWNHLRGTVCLACQSAAPERVLNLCAAHEIPFWDVRWQSEERFTLRTTREGARRLAQVTQETDAALTTLEERGAPLALGRLRRRYVLVLALIMAVALIWYGNTFIWAFQVTGNDTVPTQAILRALEHNGVTIGTRSLSFDQEELRNHVLLELGDISWLSVNVKGCTAHVQVVERKRPPEMAQKGVPANIVARRDGIIQRVEALDGRALVQKGDTVQAGQLLLSGVSDGRFGGVRFMEARGRVYARTWYTLTAHVPLTAAEKTGEGERDTRLALDVGKKRIKIYGKGSITGAGCDKITVYHPLTLPFGLRLPLTAVVETTTRWETVTVTRTEAAAQAEGEALLRHELEALLGEDGEVVSAEFSAAKGDGVLTVTLTAECREEIGISVPVEAEVTE